MTNWRIPRDFLSGLGSQMDWSYLSNGVACVDTRAGGAILPPPGCYAELLFEANDCYVVLKNVTIGERMGFFKSIHDIRWNGRRSRIMSPTEYSINKLLELRREQESNV